MDTTNSNTTVLSRVLTITHPNGGENLILGTPDTIRWYSNHKSSIVVVYDPSDNNPDSLFILPGGDSVSIQPGNGSFIWTPAGRTSSVARILLFDLTDNTENWSTGTFVVGSLIPQAPRSLHVAKSGNDMLLQWSRVDSSVSGLQLSIAGYKLYKANYYLGTPALLSTITGVANTSYTHVNGINDTQNVYTVKAFTSSSSDRWNGSQSSLNKFNRGLLRRNISQ